MLVTKKFALRVYFIRRFYVTFLENQQRRENPKTNQLNIFEQ
jgi:hypothetical protein